MAQTPLKPRPTGDRQFVFAIGACSAFDLTGLRIMNSDLIRAGSDHATAPSDVIASDFARALRSFSRTMRCAVDGLARGRPIDEFTSACVKSASEAPGPPNDGDSIRDLGT